MINTGTTAVETSIAELTESYRQGRLTVAEAVDDSLARIALLDREGPALKAMVTIDERARSRAERLDRARQSDAGIGPLHGVPLVIKDNIDVAGLATTGGSAALSDLIAERDAPVVQRLLDAGAVVLGKSSMSEFAFGAYDTENSIIDGHTRNPYNPDYACGGSSGGTGVAVAAGYCVAGLGTDTGCSVRAPASINALVGLRPTHGLVDMSGIMPMNADWDTVGPLARSVADVAVMLDAMTGAIDQAGSGLNSGALAADDAKPLRVGAVRHLADPRDSAPDVLDAFEAALSDLAGAGVEVVDPIEAGVFCVPFDARAWYMRFRHDLDGFLTAPGHATSAHSLKEILDSAKVHPRYVENLTELLEWPHGPRAHPNIEDMIAVRDRYRAVFNDLLERLGLDALIFPTFRYPPVRNGSVPTTLAGTDRPVGSNNYYASLTGFPALSVPMGYAQNGLPLGLQCLGAPHQEPRLLKLAHAYERRTMHRRPPSLPT